MYYGLEEIIQIIWFLKIVLDSLLGALYEAIIPSFQSFYGLLWPPESTMSEKAVPTLFGLPLGLVIAAFYGW